MNSVTIANAVVVVEVPAEESCPMCWERREVRSTCCGRIQLQPNSTVLRCGHVYCSVCINRWVQEREGATCPMCRERVHTYKGEQGEVLAEGRTVRFKRYAKILAGCLFLAGTTIATVFSKRGIGG